MHRITKRGMVCVGENCNLRCNFCFYRYSPGKSPDKTVIELKKEFLSLKDIYGNSHVDISGGEPTIYPGIFKLIDYCRQIDLIPSIVTNAQKLVEMDFCRKLKEAGVNDIVISTHGLKGPHDLMSKSHLAFDKLVKAMNNLKKIGLPFRTNTVITRYNYMNLPELAGFLKLRDPLCCNFIMFLPIGSWQKVKQGIISNIAVKYVLAAPYLARAVNILSENTAVRTNIRFFPFCLLKGYEKYISKTSQLPFDEYSYDFASWFSDPDIKTQSAYFKYAQKSDKEQNFFAGSCRKCSVRLICGGIEKGLYAMNEKDTAPIHLGKEIKDPLYFKKRCR